MPTDWPGQDTPTVYLASSSDVLSTATAKMYQNQLISDAGGTNVGAELEDTYWATISYEQLLAWDPDYIVLVPEASYTVEDVCADPQLAGLSAVQNGRVLQMPTSLSRGILLCLPPSWARCGSAARCTPMSVTRLLCRRLCRTSIRNSMALPQTQRISVIS